MQRRIVNEYVVMAINVALRGATGHYVRILDADDSLATDECAKYPRVMVEDLPMVFSKVKMV